MPLAADRRGRAAAAVEAHEAAIAAEDAAAVDWDDQSPGITMHPFLAVRRMTEKQLQREIQIAKDKLREQVRDRKLPLPLQLQDPGVFL